MNRRSFLLTGALLSARVATALAAGLLVPTRVIAQWPGGIFASDNLETAINSIAVDKPVKQSDRIKIESRAFAEDGSAVAVGIRWDIPDTRMIVLISEKNPAPVIARYHVGAGIQPYLKTRIKMSGSGHLLVIADTDSGLYSRRKEIRVTAGGCS